jgi:hypothetical protein
VLRQAEFSTSALLTRPLLRPFSAVGDAAIPCTDQEALNTRPHRPALLLSAPNTALLIKRAAIAARKAHYVLQRLRQTGRAVTAVYIEMFW